MTIEMSMFENREGNPSCLPFPSKPACPSWRFGRALLLLVSTAIVGCGHTTVNNAGRDEAGATSEQIGAVLPMFSHPFFVAQKAGMERQAKEMGVSIDVRDGQDDDQKQINQVEALLTVGPDAIVLCPRDENALIPAVEAANQSGIPVIALNRRVNGGEVVTYVGADDADGGRAQAHALAEALGPDGGMVIYLQGTPGSSPQVSREAGFKDVLAGHPEISLVADQYTDFQEDTAKEIMSGLALRFQPGEVRAIVAQADELALPAAEVARASGWDDVIVIGFNGTSQAFSAIRAGQMHATILQDAAEQGRLAVEAAVKHLRGESLPTEILTPLPVVTLENIDEYEPAY